MEIDHETNPQIFGWFSSSCPVYKRINLHFPMVFPWFSHGFPMVKLPCLQDVLFEALNFDGDGLIKSHCLRDPEGPKDGRIAMVKYMV